MIQNPKSLQQWLDAVVNKELAEDQSRRAGCELQNAINELGKECLPEDANPDETFYVVVNMKNEAKMDGDTIKRYLWIRCVAPSSKEYRVGWRK